MPFQSNYEWNFNFPQLARESGFICNNKSAEKELNWKIFSNIDTENVIKNKDFECLDSVIPYISDASLCSILDSGILDPAIIKYFKIAQLCVQYLLFCKQFLDKSVSDLRLSIFESQRDNIRLQKLNKRSHEKLQEVKDKYIIQDNQKQTIFPCTKCTKNFISYDLLGVHMMRKHSGENEQIQKNCDKNNDINLINTIKLELEIKQLKERLNATEQELNVQHNKEIVCQGCDKPPKRYQNSSNNSNYNTHSIGVQSSFEEEKKNNEIKQSEASIQVNNEVELTALLKTQLNMFEEWKIVERKKYDDEINELKIKLDELSKQSNKSNDKMTTLDSPTSKEIKHYEEEMDKMKQHYSSLEELYKQSQDQMKETIKTINEQYDGKIKIIEDLVKSSLHPIEPTSVINDLPKKETINQKTSKEKHIMNVQEKSATSDESSEDSSTSEEIIVQQPVKIPPVMHNESKPKNKAKRFTVNKLTKPIEPTLLIKKLSKISTPRIDEVKTKFVEKKVLPQLPPATDTVTVTVSPKENALKLFGQKLASFGIKTKNKYLTKSKYTEISANLMRQRMVNKKRNKTYIQTREALAAEINKLAMDKLNKITEILPEEEQPSEIQTNDEISSESDHSMTINSNNTFIIEKSPKIVEVESKTTVKPAQQLVTENVVTVMEKTEKSLDLLNRNKNAKKQPEIITVKNLNDKKKLFNSEIPRNRLSFDVENESALQKSVEELILSPIRKPIQSTLLQAINNEKPKIINDYKDESSLSELALSELIKPKPAPRKKVIFDLHETRNLDITPNQKTTKAIQEEKQQMSDWEISSFEDERI